MLSLKEKLESETSLEMFVFAEMIVSSLLPFPLNVLLLALRGEGSTILAPIRPTRENQREERHREMIILLWRVGVCRIGNGTTCYSSISSC